MSVFACKPVYYLHAIPMGTRRGQCFMFWLPRNQSFSQVLRVQMNTLGFMVSDTDQG